MRARWISVLALATATAMGVSGCGAGSSDTAANSVSVVGFSVLKTANQKVIEDFQATAKGKDVTFKTSYGASGDQSRAVLAGLKADEVHLSLEPDVAKLADGGVVSKDWKSGPTKGIITQSVVVLVVRKGNPKQIKSWADLVKPGVQVVTPNPGSSGSAKWNLLAAYGQVKANGGSDADATAYVTKLIDNAAALPGSASDALTTFTGGTGDVLLSYENEAIIARQGGADIDYVVPDQTLLIQNAGAVTEGASQSAKDFLAFQLSKEGQSAYAEVGFRPLDDTVKVEVKGANDPKNPFPAPKKLLTVDSDFGGWTKANSAFFDEATGVISKIIAGSGKA